MLTFTKKLVTNSKEIIFHTNSHLKNNKLKIQNNFSKQKSKKKKFIQKKKSSSLEFMKFQQMN